MARKYMLVNIDKEEKIDFAIVDTGTKINELTGTSIASAIITHYMLTNIGDKISFIDDHQTQFSLFGENYALDIFNSYKDVTKIVVEALIQNKIFQNEGVVWIDKEDDLWHYNVTNVWKPNK